MFKKKEQIKKELKETNIEFQRPIVKRKKIADSYKEQHSRIERFLAISKISHHRNTMYRIILEMPICELEKYFYIMFEGIVQHLFEPMALGKLFYRSLGRLVNLENNDVLENVAIKYLVAQLNSNPNYHKYFDYITRNRSCWILNNRKLLLDKISDGTIVDRVRKLKKKRSNMEVIEYKDMFYYVR